MLIKIIENAIDTVTLSSKMKKVLSLYIDFEDSVDSREHDFDEFDFNIPTFSENDQDHEITISGNITEHNDNTEILS
jgi:hypothetical protein